MTVIAVVTDCYSCGAALVTARAGSVTTKMGTTTTASVSGVMALDVSGNVVIVLMLRSVQSVSVVSRR